jgi:hypothetical protein
VAIYPAARNTQDLRYFAYIEKDGIRSQCHCPYCGHSGDNKTFFTQEQIEYAKSVVIRQVTDAFHKDCRFATTGRKSSKPKSSAKTARCDTRSTACSDWCPDCGVHNSLQILTKNFELVRKELVLAQSPDKELADHLVGDALENLVSAFDGFGREVCARKTAEIRFQNLAAARRKAQEVFGFDFADSLAPEEWNQAFRTFQKRHLLSHKMGVIDEEYVQKTNDPGAIVGRRIQVTQDEVTAAIGIIEKLGRRLFAGVLHPAS